MKLKRVLKRVNVRFGTLKVGQTCLLKHVPGELVSKADESTAFAPYGLGFRMYADDIVSIECARLCRALERVRYGMSSAARRA